MLRYPFVEGRLVTRYGLAAGLLALAVAGCKNESVKVEPADTNYYPLTVGDFRIYNVVDTTWNRGVRVDTAGFQFRERVSEEFVDAAGHRSFRVVRSRRDNATKPWRDDSVLVVNPSTDNVLVTRSNRRTVELIFPVRANYIWNMNAFNKLDPVTAQNRQFVDVNKPFTSTSNGITYAYPLTITAFDESIEKIYYPYTRRQVYVSGQGLVYRHFRAFTLCETGNCTPSFSNVFRGFSRTEVLVEKGRLF